MYKLLFLLILLLHSACNRKENRSSWILEEKESYLDYELDSYTRIPFYIHTFTIGKDEYMCFQNFSSPEILIYHVATGKLIKKVTFDREGDNAIAGGFLEGFSVIDFNHIYISGLADCTIYVTDTTGIIHQKLNYAKASDGKPLLHCWRELGELRFIGDTLFLPQQNNFQFGERMIEESPVMACMDTISKTVTRLPMRFPPLVTIHEMGTFAGTGNDYKSCYDGENFIYSFCFMDELWKTDRHHAIVHKTIAKSKYADNIKVVRFSTDNEKLLQKKNCEVPSYGNILYDKYRHVYYRFVYPPVEMENDVDYLSILRTGRKQASIMILDHDLKVIGESLLPPYRYNTYLCFIREDGLYISTANAMNPTFNEDILRFQKFELKYIEDKTI